MNIQETLQSLQSKLQFIADIHTTNNHKLDENLISEYDLSLDAVNFCQLAVNKLIEKMKEASNG